MLQQLIDELKAYYWTHSAADPDAHGLAKAICARMDAFDERNAGLSPFLLKATLHETIADMFVPVIFPHSPFYSEMGVKPAESWGVPFDEHHAGGWMFRKRCQMFRMCNEKNDRIRALRTEHAISMFYGIFPDSDHHCFPAGIVLKNGLAGLHEQATVAAETCRNRDELDFLEAARRSLLAVRRIGNKFAERARAALPAAEDEECARFLRMIAATAAEVPWRAPRTFYEGLATMWFLREVAATIEGIGISVIGHVDRLLIGLYRSDVAAGRLTAEEAFDLVCRFLLPTDHKRDLRRSYPVYYPNPFETSTTLVLGGCDEAGREVCSELTFMFLKAHEHCGLLNPKLNCRYSPRSDPAYLNEINRQLLAGRNVFALFNDDCLIDAQVRGGKRMEDARLYVAGGCHEPIVGRVRAFRGRLLLHQHAAHSGYIDPRTCGDGGGPGGDRPQVPTAGPGRQFRGTLSVRALQCGQGCGADCRADSRERPRLAQGKPSAVFLGRNGRLPGQAPGLYRRRRPLQSDGAAHGRLCQRGGLAARDQTTVFRHGQVLASRIARRCSRRLEGA
jgi:hypothetical protein